MVASLPVPIAILSAITLLIYFCVLVSLSSKKIRFTATLEKITISFFILLIAGGWDKIFVFSKLNPNHILTQGQPPGLAFTIIFITFSATLIALNLKLRASSERFLIGLKHFALYNPTLALLIFLTPTSALWSITPLFTLARGLIFVGVILIAIYIASNYHWDDIFSLLRWSFAFVMLQSAFLAVAVPSLGLHGKGWQGSFSHAGTLGLYAAFTALLWLIELLSHKKKSLTCAGILGFSMFVMHQTSSATALILLIQGIGIVLVISLLKRLKPKLSVAVTIIFLALIIPIIYSLILNFDDLLVLLGKTPSLTGRGVFWPQLIQKVAERPVLGYGFEGFWLPWKAELNPAAAIKNSNSYVPQHAHNGFLDLSLNLGLTGLLLYATTLYSCLLKITQCAQVSRSHILIPLISLLFIITANTSGNGLWEVGFHSFLFTLIATRLSLDVLRSWV